MKLFRFVLPLCYVNATQEDSTKSWIQGDSICGWEMKEGYAIQKMIGQIRLTSAEEALKQCEEMGSDCNGVVKGPDGVSTLRTGTKFISHSSFSRHVSWLKNCQKISEKNWTQDDMTCKWEMKEGYSIQKMIGQIRLTSSAEALTQCEEMGFDCNGVVTGADGISTLRTGTKFISHAAFSRFVSWMKNCEKNSADTDSKNDLLLIKADFINRMSGAFGADSRFLKSTSKPLNNLTKRLSFLYDRHFCNENQSRKRRSTDPSFDVCDKLASDIDRIISWADNIGECGSPKRRNRSLGGTLKKLNSFKASVEKRCPKKVIRKAKGKKV